VITFFDAKQAIKKTSEAGEELNAWEDGGEGQRKRRK